MMIHEVKFSHLSHPHGSIMRLCVDGEKCGEDEVCLSVEKIIPRDESREREHYYLAEMLWEMYDAISAL